MVAHRAACLALATLGLVSQASSSDAMLGDDLARSTEALAEDDACRLGDGAACALSALQVRARTHLGQDTAKVTNRGDGQPLSIPMSKRRRDYLRRSPPGFDGSRRSPMVMAGNNGALQGSAGTDYAVDVVIGGETFQVIVDTGSSVFAVAASPLDGCLDYYTGTQEYCTGPFLQEIYGSGNWTGKQCQGPEVTLAGLSAGAPPFAGITEQKQFFNDCDGEAENMGMSSDGIMGMAFADLIGGTGFTGNPLFDYVVETTGIPNLFSMQCCSWNGQTAGTGQITLGGIDESLYTGEIQYTPITRELYYCVQMLDIVVPSGTQPSTTFTTTTSTPPESCLKDTGGTCFFAGCDAWRGATQCEFGLCRCQPGYCEVDDGSCQSEYEWYALMQSRNRSSRGVLLQHRTVEAHKSHTHITDCGTIVDSGTSELVLAKPLFEKVMKGLQSVADAVPSSSNCVTEDLLGYFPDILILLAGGIELKVPPTTYFQPQADSACYDPFIGSLGSLSAGLDGGHTPNILGQVLMEAYYTVFDKGGRRVGFAPIAGC